MKRRLLALVITVSLLATAAVTAAAAPAAGPCLPGGSYDPACDVDRDGDVDIFDIQLTAGRWNTNGVWTTDGWSLTGNAGTTPGTNFLGTTDNQALHLHVNGSRALRIQPGSDGRPNIIGGHSDNGTQPGVYGATIGGGGTTGSGNWVYDTWGTVGGGYNNEAGSDDSSVSSDLAATVGGGTNNTASGNRATVAGGNTNTANGSWATIGGGEANSASGSFATIGGGGANTASGAATVGGGQFNSASNAFATVGGGNRNIAGGAYATIAGGDNNAAAGDYSFAAGRRAKANHSGAFVLADSNNFDVASTVANSMRARFTGGMRMIVGIDANGNFTANCLLTQATGSWSCSSLAAMENVQTADSRAILDRLSQLPVLTWQAGAEGVRHIGPAEQDFHAAFGLGQPGEGISTLDLDGVALASIQALYQMVQEKDAQIAALQQGNSDLQARLATIEQALGIGQ